MTVKEKLYLMTLCSICFVVALLSQLPPLRAQFDAPQTFVQQSAIGGTASAITMTIQSVRQLSDLLAVPIRFIPPNSSVAGGTTINVTGSNGTQFGAVGVVRASGGGLVVIAGGDLSNTVMAEVIYDGTYFELQNPAAGTDQVGTEETFMAGTTVPAGFLIENGSCISQTTYSALYAYFVSNIWATQAGASCSAGNFALPLANGSTAVAYDQQGGVTAGKLTNAGSGCAATAVAVGCGSQNVTIARSGLPNTSITLSGSQTITNVISLNNPAQALVGGGSAGSTSYTINGSSFNFALNGGVTQTTTTTVPPTYTVLKAIRY